MHNIYLLRQTLPAVLFEHVLISLSPELHSESKVHKDSSTVMICSGPTFAS